MLVAVQMVAGLQGGVLQADSIVFHVCAVSRERQAVVHQREQILQLGVLDEDLIAGGGTA
jgi:hypothetical protein